KAQAIRLRTLQQMKVTPLGTSVVAGHVVGTCDGEPQLRQAWRLGGEMRAGDPHPPQPTVEKRQA
ncbi:MAG: hypothetical protein ABGW98_03205, partial [Myxococcales bacterium]